jgi:ketosteroid isomerase-like protein
MRWVPITLLGVVLSCGAPPGKPAQAPRPQGDDVDAKTAVRDAKALLDEVSNAVRGGHTDALLPTVVEDVVVLGPGAKHHFASRADAVVAISGFLNTHHDALEFSSGKPVVGVAPGGHSAWLVENLTVGNDAFIVTTLTSEKNEIARLAAVFMSPSVPLKKLRKLAKSDKLTLPAASLPATFKDAPAAAGAIAAFNKGIKDPTLWEADLLAQSDSGKALVIGPSIEQFATGTKAITKYWKKRTDNGVALKLLDKPRGGTTEDGQLAWVTAAAEQTEENDDPVRLRVFAIYVQNEEGVWQLAALHQAVSIVGL